MEKWNVNKNKSGIRKSGSQEVIFVPHPLTPSSLPSVFPPLRLPPSLLSPLDCVVIYFPFLANTCDRDAALFPNSRNGSFAKTVASEIGDIELAIPRDRNGTFTPMLVPKGARRLDGLDAIIVSLCSRG